MEIEVAQEQEEERNLRGRGPRSAQGCRWSSLTIGGAWGCSVGMVATRAALALWRDCAAAGGRLASGNEAAQRKPRARSRRDEHCGGRRASARSARALLAWC